MKYQGLKIALLPSYGSVLPFIVDCIARGLEAQGATVYRVPYITKDKELSFDHKVLDSILTFKPDYAFFLGLNGYIHDANKMKTGEHFLHVNKIPYANFFFDFTLRFSRLNYYKNDFLRATFIWDRDYVPILQQSGFRSVHYLPLGTDQGYFSPPRGEAHRMDISFVGSIPGLELIKSHKDKLPAGLVDTAEKIIKKKIADPAMNIYSQDLVFNTSIQQFFTDFYGYIYTRHLVYSRKDYIYSLAKEHEINIYGNEEWQGLRNDHIKTNPVVNYQSDLLSVFHQSKLNLNFSASQLASSINQRIFDCFGSGNFLLTDYRPDIKHLFPEVDIPYFDSKQTLLEKTRYYLEHPDERQALTDKIQKIIIEKHTWSKRMEQALDTICQTGTAPAGSAPVTGQSL